MSFPKNSRMYQAEGRAGTKATDNPVNYAPYQPVAGENGVTAGLFAWKTAGINGSEVYNPDTYLNSGTGAPVGIVSAESGQTYLGYNEEASMLIPAGQGVMVAETGDWFVQTKTAATAGQKVFANLSTGEVYTASAGGTVDGAVETDWIVSKGGAVEDMIIISRRG